MNKSELVSAIAGDAGITKKDAELAVNSFVEVVGEALSKGESVSLIGFGTFLTRDRKARDGRNPKTGETIKIAARTVPAFKAGKKLKEVTNK